jgi:hypothetical protein
MSIYFYNIVNLIVEVKFFGEQEERILYLGYTVRKIFRASL